MNASAQKLFSLYIYLNLIANVVLYKLKSHLAAGITIDMVLCGYVIHSPHRPYLYPFPGVSQIVITSQAPRRLVVHVLLHLGLHFFPDLSFWPLQTCLVDSSRPSCKHFLPSPRWLQFQAKSYLPSGCPYDHA